ncbi:hypothetical protein ACLKA6_006048 [Drosophila palustris]
MSEGSKGTDRTAKDQLTVPTASTARRSSTSSIPSGTRTPSNTKGSIKSVVKPKVVFTFRIERSLPASPALRTSSNTESLKPKREPSALASGAKTRSIGKATSSASIMAVSNLISVTDKLCQFESRVNTNPSDDDKVFTFDYKSCGIKMRRSTKCAQRHSDGVKIRTLLHHIREVYFQIERASQSGICANYTSRTSTPFLFSRDPAVQISCTTCLNFRVGCVPDACALLSDERLDSRDRGVETDRRRKLARL